VDDYGNVFRRGGATALNVHDWQALSASAIADSFLRLKPQDGKVQASCSDKAAPPTAGTTQPAVAKF